ncbi:glucose-6-phosphate 1-dehydrogenase [Schizosaccharomyces japonicus yFS275]|uniref:glucose-6-phosphate dehydrogenase (NADP(+)) n=1 Tax=Schizosaccharomyces japonicus (strain yFS275 / FY16936) TaxID=402676 RepID=B6K0X8_SCHJY|nr:glucose-6-phosphate 1-dehydrogenase [Schizosaccharomyces japonicus yFS275]EEB07599.2 glucose-6-phosphate 1-dehydrogenase [Schizosaccharomyces japonicus yFS275]
MISFVVFGASGDLAAKKTFPALFQLFKKKAIERDQFRIIGFARSNLSNADFENIISMHSGEEQGSTVLKSFRQHSEYFRGNYSDKASFEKLNEKLKSYEEQDKSVLRIFYLAVPPSVFFDVCSNIHKTTYLPNNRTRIIVEKPFGMDYDSADMIMNLPIMRFMNPGIDAMFNHEHVESVEIFMKESGTCEGREGYFNSNGVVRDVLQNHLMQLFSAVAMDPPRSADASDIRNAKVKLLQAAKPFRREDTLFGQYVKSADGSKKGYLDLKGIPEDSNTATFVASTLYVDNERWKGVPFVFVTGKALNENDVHVSLHLRPKDMPYQSKGNQSRLVTFSIQPKEYVAFDCLIKRPTMAGGLHTAELKIDYDKDLEDVYQKYDAYEALFYDAIKGNPTRFVRSDEVEAGWRIVNNILDPKEPCEKYTFGSAGPKQLREYLHKYLYLETSKKT